MTVEHLCLLLVVVPPAVWMIFSSHRRSGFRQLLIKIFGAAIIVMPFCLLCFVQWESRAAAHALADALAGPSAKELQHRCEPTIDPIRESAEYPKELVSDACVKLQRIRWSRSSVGAGHKQCDPPSRLAHHYSTTGGGCDSLSVSTVTDEN